MSDEVALGDEYIQLVYINHYISHYISQYISHYTRDLVLHEPRR